MDSPGSDESTDITAQTQLLIFARFLKESPITEELLACISLETTTRGEDIFNGIDKFFTENNLDWNKVIECSMDGAPSMMERILDCWEFFRGNILTLK